MTTDTPTLRLTRFRSSVPILLIVVGLLLTGAVFANPRCDYCRKLIDSTYIQYGGRTYHTACYHQHVAPRCAICGQEIVNDGLIYEENNYHRTCFEDKVALRCSVCGEIIVGEYLLDHWGNKYHKYHEQEIASCSFCGRLFSDPQAGGGIDFDATHKICLSCAQAAVTDQRTAQRQVDETLAIMGRIGIVIKPDAFKFKLVSREELGRLTGKANPDQFGLTRYEKTEYWGFLESKELMLYVLAELPRTHFISAAAHELMHAWLFLNSRYDSDGGDPELIEGSCNGASLLVLRDLDDEMARYVIRQLEDEPDTVYGGGFRRAEHLIDNRGVEYWLQHLRLDPEFPIGY